MGSLAFPFRQCAFARGHVGLHASYNGAILPATQKAQRPAKGARMGVAADLSLIVGLFNCRALPRTLKEGPSGFDVLIPDRETRSRIEFFLIKSSFIRLTKSRSVNFRHRIMRIPIVMEPFGMSLIV